MIDPAGVLITTGTPFVEPDLVTGETFVSLTATATTASGPTNLSGTGTLTAAATLAPPEAHLTGDGTLDVAARLTVSGAAALTGTGVLAAAATRLLVGRIELSGTASLDASTTFAGNRRRLLVVDKTGTLLAELENAVIGDIISELNRWETVNFTVPVTDAKAHFVLDEHIREAQVWFGDQLLVWGPMTRPQPDMDSLPVTVQGAAWYLSRRNVGKANRTNRLTNPDFEDGGAGWGFLRTQFDRDYQPLDANSVGLYSPAKRGTRALQITSSLAAWSTPGTSAATHTVVSGDTLWAIADAYYGNPLRWPDIYDANQAQIQADAIAHGLWNPHDPGHWIFPGQVFTIPGIAGTAAPPDDNPAWGGVFGYQNVTVTAGQRPVEATFVAWVKVPSANLIGYNVENRCVVIARLPSTWATDNYWTQTGGVNGWGGARAFYSDLIEQRVATFDERTPRDVWLRMEVSITVPAGATEVLHCRVEGVQGVTYFDACSLTYDDALEFFDTDQASIVAGIVSHAQDPAFDKNNVNLTTDAQPTGVLRDLVALYDEHPNCWRLIEDYTKLDDGIDISTHYTPTQRVITTHYPQAGNRRPSLALQLGRNIADFRYSFDGEQAATSVIALGTGDGSDREEASAIDTTGFAAGLILEEAFSVPPNTPIEALPSLATGRLNVVRNPEVLEVVTYPHDSTLRERNLIGRLWVGDVVPVYISRGGLLVNTDYRIVRHVIRPDDALALTLNRWTG